MEITHKELQQGKVSAWVATKVFLWVAFVVGLGISLKVTFAISRVDPDISHSALLWFGLHQEGWQFLKEWLYTSDNWLFSWCPLHFIIFQFLGVDPKYIVFTGWLVFVGNAVVSGLIARALGGRKTALIVPVLLLFSGLYAHSFGMASYSMSHNITNLCGLLMLLCFIGWNKKPKDIFLVGMFVFGFTGGISDPWLLATYVLPVALGSLGGIASSSGENRRALTLAFLVAALLGVTLKTRCFGLLDFLPLFKFHLANWTGICHNANFFCQCIGGLFCSTQPSNLIPRMVTATALAILIFITARLFLKNRAWTLPGATTLLWIIPLSLGGISTAFIISKVEAAEYCGRFLINWLYLAPIFIAVALERHWDRTSTALRAFSLTSALAFAAAGIISTTPLLCNHNAYEMDQERIGLQNFLDEHGLNYGYGPYWGSMANAITWATDQRIRIRPLMFSHTTGAVLSTQRPEVSPYWFSEKDAPANQKKYFILLKNDGEECQDVDLCRRGLTWQFGQPENVLTYQNSMILVWNRPLFDFYKTVEPGQKIQFTTNEPPIPWKGWNSAEKEGTWSDGPVSELKLQMPTIPTGNLTLVLEANGWVAKKQPFRHYSVYVNGHQLKNIRFTKNSSLIHTIKIPAEIAKEREGKLLVQLRTKKPRSPSDLHAGKDFRKIGIFLHSVRLDLDK